MSASYKISDEAYGTIILHASKYVSAINGLLLGKKGAKNCIEIHRAIPIAHSALTISTTPLAETALHLAEARAAQQNLQLVGAYYGNEVADDTSIGTFPTRLADAVRATYPPACLLMIDAARLAPDVRSRQHCMRLCVRGEQVGTWARGRRPDAELEVSEAALKFCDDSLGGKCDVGVVIDFEDHCLDPSKDWFNMELGSRISAVSAKS